MGAGERGGPAGAPHGHGGVGRHELHLLPGQPERALAGVAVTRIPG